MITLCIDPGLRNLSLCIMNSDYQILLWDTYNILDSDNYHCQSICKNGNVCNKKCSMKYKKESEIIYTCKLHFPKNTKKSIFKKKNINEYLLQDIAKEFINKINELYMSNNVFKLVDSIFIELQPKCNAKMLFISHILYGKLVELYKNENTKIRFIRASQKLKVYTGPHIECKLKGAYSKRKWLSIKYGEWFLENLFSKEEREKWIPTLTGKLDDRYDTLLMAINSIKDISKKFKK
jgi:hypothetical protein